MISTADHKCNENKHCLLSVDLLISVRSLKDAGMLCSRGMKRRAETEICKEGAFGTLLTSIQCLIKDNGSSSTTIEHEEAQVSSTLTERISQDLIGLPSLPMNKVDRVEGTDYVYKGKKRQWRNGQLWTWVYCDYEGCNASFYTSSALNRHKRAKHTGEKPFKCDLCDAAFVTKRELNKHTMYTLSDENLIDSEQSDAGFVPNRQLNHCMPHCARM